jgi:hypothetical protein
MTSSTVDVVIDDHDLADWLAAFRIAGRVLPALRWEPTAAMPVNLPSGHVDTLTAMGDDPWHDHWVTAGEALASLTGTWLHPETRWSCDPYAIWRTHAGIFIGCCDLDTPDAPRRFDAAADCLARDIGVIAFPYPAATIYQLVAGGASGDALGVAGVTVALCAAGLHEAYEHAARRLGRVDLNPHRADMFAAITVTVDGVDRTATVNL